MLSKENKRQVQELYKRLIERYEIFKTSHFTCLEVCDDLELNDALKKHFQSCQTNFDEFKERYTQWNADYEESIPSRAASFASR